MAAGALPVLHAAIRDIPATKVLAYSVWLEELEPQSELSFKPHCGERRRAACAAGSMTRRCVTTCRDLNLPDAGGLPRGGVVPS